MRRAVLTGLAIAAAIGLASCGAGSDGESGASPSRARVLPSRETSATGLIKGGSDEFERRMDALKGRPVVVNQWASWCPPCRAEFPFFARAARTHAGKVAFLGVNSGDMTPEAEDFLRANPTPYPHLEDKKAVIAREFGGGRSWPTTAFYDADGEIRHVTPGGYPSIERLERDIQEYALDG